MPHDLHAALVARQPLSGAYVLLTFEHPDVARTARAGQFVMIKAGTSPEPPLRRPFSVLTVDPVAGTFGLFLKAVGPGSRALAALPVGGRAACLGPLGRPFSHPRDGEEALMVAGGYGIAPFRMLSTELRAAGRGGRVFYGGRTAGDLQVQEPFAEMGIPLVLSTDDGSAGHHGRVTEPLEAWLDAAAGPCRLYACGPEAMLHAVARLAERRSLPAEVSLDPWMGCGIGTCLGCVVKVQAADEDRPHNRCACTEGPVFDSRVVVWPGDAASAARRTSQAVGASR
jgi:dihydroorotate dehydrogenase electron transfer subunit